MKFNKMFLRESGEVYYLNPKVAKMSYRERVELFKKLIMEEYIGKTVELYQYDEKLEVGFERSSAQKGIYGDKKSSPKGWNAKINIGAAGEYIRLIENAQYSQKTVENGKNLKEIHKKTKEWNYFVKTIVFEGVGFDVLINVRKNREGKFLVYDVTLLEETKRLINKSLSVASTNNCTAFTSGETLIKNNISKDKK